MGELRTAERSSDPAAPEPAVLLYPSATAVPHTGRGVRGNRKRKGRVHWRRRKPPCLPGSVWKVDCGGVGGMGYWMWLPCAWSLHQCASLQTVDQLDQLELYICKL